MTKPTAVPVWVILAILGLEAVGFFGLIYWWVGGVRITGL